MNQRKKVWIKSDQPDFEICDLPELGAHMEGRKEIHTQRSKSFLLLFFLTLLHFSLFPPKALADKRNYVWTYEYQTMKRGEAEVEDYFTISTPDSGGFKGKAIVEHQIELEVGMTDRFDFAIYQIFRQKPDEPLKYEGYKLRWRYRFGEKNQYFLDPLLYLEYTGVPDFSEHKIEIKGILAKDWKRWNLALNPHMEWEREKGKWESNPGYAVGMSYGFHRLLRLGIEIKGSENGHYIGPVIAHGKGDLWVTLGSAFKISHIDAGKPEVQIRMLLGVGVGGGHKEAGTGYAYIH